MGSDARPKSSALVRGAIIFVYSQVKSRRSSEMLAAVGLMLLVAAIVLLPPELLGQIVTKSTAGGRVDTFDIFPSIQHISRIIKYDHVSVAYELNDGSAFKALNDLVFHVAKNEIVGLADLRNGK